jgi:hypothetical protein
MMISGKKGFSATKTFVMLPAVIACLLAGTSNLSAAQWSVGVSGGDNGVNSFHLSVGEYYHVPVREVVVVRERGIPEEELPVVFFIAGRAHVRPDRVVVLRERGMSWMDITLHFGLSPDIYYVPVRSAHPYGHAYGYYKNHHRNDWKKMRFRDRDIVNQVNLRFISDHHGYAPEKIMKERGDGKAFIRIHENASHKMGGRTDHRRHADNGRNEKGQGNSKNRH